MKCSAFLLPMLGLAFAPSALAQPARAPKTSSDPAIETVVVTAEKTPESIVHYYVRSYAAPEPHLEKITSWNFKKRHICPNTIGFTPSVNAFVTARIREVAAMVGAPVNPKQDCKSNIAVIVTPEPQALLDKIRADREDLLGYYQSPSEGDRLAMVNHPIQAWYATATEDYNGNSLPDVYYNPQCPFGCSYAVTGLRARDGLVSELRAVTIVADRNKITGYQLGAFADYVAMLALSRTQDFAACPETPSITSLVSPYCPSSGMTLAITATDLAYLRGVYKMDSGGSLRAQLSTIASEITKTLEAR